MYSASTPSVFYAATVWPIPIRADSKLAKKIRHLFSVLIEQLHLDAGVWCLPRVLYTVLVDINSYNIAYLERIKPRRLHHRSVGTSALQLSSWESPPARIRERREVMRTGAPPASMGPVIVGHH
jgi:hypothetical protein